MNIQDLVKISRTLKLLYVEDDASLREKTLSLLENFFTDIKVALDGNDGLELFRENKFDLIISDVSMPDLDGIEMISKIRALDKNVSVLFISAYNESSDIARAVELNIDGYLPKPFNIHSFKMILSSVCEKINLKRENLSYQNALKRHNSDLQKQKDAFETLFEKSSDGILIIEDGHFVQCNERIVNMLRYDSKDKLLHTHPSKLSPEYQPDGKNSFKKAEEMIDLAFKKGGHAFEWIHTRANGEDFWTEVVLTPISLLDREIIHVVWRDISKRKDMEYKLQQYTNEIEMKFDELAISNKESKRQEAYLKKSQEIAHIGVWEFRVKDGNILYWSDEVYKIFDVDSKVFKPSFEELLKLVHPEDRDALDEEFASSIIEKRDYYFSHRIIRSDATLCYVEERATHEYDENGEIIKTTGVILDISQKKELELELLSLNKDLDKRVKEEVRKNKEKEQQLFAQSRLAQMGEMISMIAHQWRQPLGAISSSAANLKLKLQLEVFKLDTQKSKDECHDYFIARLEDMEGYVESLTGTIDDFRNFYKPNKKSVKTTSENIVIKALNIIRASLLNANIELIEEYICKDELEMYDGEMMQVILNILKNAQDNFIEKDTQNPKITIRTQGKIVTICDNGGGISPEVIEKIFDPYFSTKDAKNGTGLGLYMSKTIVEEHHNGKLTVLNTKDGVCFGIDLNGEGIK